MAIYSLPTLTSRITGSRKGITFQKAGNNFIIRRRSAIVQKRSIMQSSAKSLLASRSQVWRSLSPAQQATWLAQIGNYTRINSLGITYDILANQLQIWTNVNAELLGDPQVNTGSPPVAYPVYIYGQLGFAGGPQFLEAQIRNSMNLADFTIPIGFDAKVYFTPGLSPGQNQPPDFVYKLVSVLPSGFDTQNHNYYSDYLATFAPLVVGSSLQIWSAFKLVSLTNYIDDDLTFSEGEVL